MHPPHPSRSCVSRRKLILLLAICALTHGRSLRAAPGDRLLADLEHRGWTPQAQQMLQDLLRPAPRGSAPVATLDWDNTMILNDIGDATFIHLVDTMGFTFDAGFWERLPAHQREQVRAYAMTARVLSPAQRPRSPEYRAYRKGLLLAYEELCQGQGDSVCLQWVVQQMSGMKVAEVRAAAQAALDAELARPVGMEEVKRDPDDRYPLRIHRGIRYYPEMQRLVSDLAHHGFDVWVVSASAQWIVEVAAKRVGIPADHVLGVLVDVDSQDRLTDRIARFTWRQGKADAIRTRIGKPPSFAAGDSTTDLEMLLMGQGPRLVMDRGKVPLMDLAQQRQWIIQPPFLVPTKDLQSAVTDEK